MQLFSERHCGVEPPTMFRGAPLIHGIRLGVGALPLGYCRISWGGERAAPHAQSQLRRSSCHTFPRRGLVVDFALNVFDNPSGLAGPNL